MWIKRQIIIKFIFIHILMHISNGLKPPKIWKHSINNCSESFLTRRSRTGHCRRKIVNTRPEFNFWSFADDQVILSWLRNITVKEYCWITCRRLLSSLRKGTSRGLSASDWLWPGAASDSRSHRSQSLPPTSSEASHPSSRAHLPERTFTG